MQKILSSFRDPGGFVYTQGNSIFRQINPVYQEQYNHFIKSGLYSTLVRNNLLIPHEELSKNLIKPEKLDFISYPFEWCFSQLKDAALTTLAVQKQAMQYNMTLKDATAYNIQFQNGHPVFIDTLSFVKYNEGDSWIPYRQFCQHFLAPLMLMSYTDIRCGQLFKVYPDGIPLDLARRLLRAKALTNLNYWIHIFAQSESQRHPTKKQISRTSKFMVIGLINNLEKGIRSLNWKIKGKWMDYVSVQEKNILTPKNK